MMTKTIFISGASNGIGKATALHFAENGHDLVLTYKHDKEGMKAVQELCESKGVNVTTLQLDVTNEASITQAINEMTKDIHTIACLINNAGIIYWKPLEEQTKDEIDEQINTNLTGMIKLTKALLPHVTDTVINIASGAGKQGYADLTTYCATKFGVRGFTKALAQETDLKVLCVNPGMTKTRMTNYNGVEPEEVADIIYNTYKGTYNKSSGDDVDVWEYL